LLSAIVSIVSSFFFLLRDIFFLFGDVTGIMFNRLKLTLFAFFISRRIGTD
jgi:hypothetical protein